MKQGEQKSPHKYLRRITRPDGTYEYVYKESAIRLPTQHQKAREMKKHHFMIELPAPVLAIIDRLKYLAGKRVVHQRDMVQRGQKRKTVNKNY